MERGLAAPWGGMDHGWGEGEAEGQGAYSILVMWQQGEAGRGIRGRQRGPQASARPRRAKKSP